MEQFDNRLSDSRKSKNSSMFESLRGISISHSQISSNYVNVGNDLFIAIELRLIIAVISKNERIIDGEPRFRSRSWCWCRYW